jgi:hypothetical protein
MVNKRFHKTMLNEFYQVAFRKKIHRSVEELQADLGTWFREYNEVRPHQGRWCYGKMPMQTFLDSVPLANAKLLAVAWGEEHAMNDIGHLGPDRTLSGQILTSTGDLFQRATALRM